MVGQRKKKYEAGEGAQYWTRATALKRLQLSLKDFRKLCILKGIYPREPRGRKRAQRGGSGVKILYYKKDIQFLMHEPVIRTLRELKVHGRKIGRAKSMREYKTMKHLLSKHPTFTLDHIVKERYPTFIDALRDLDDCLNLCFLFSTFPSLRNVPRDQSILCRRLTVEFMHAVIAARALRKVFVSIKGYYFQAEIKGQTITWIIPHQFPFEPQKKAEVDFRIMSTFTQFYTVLLGFVNFHLYHSLNLIYPPRFNDFKEAYKEQKDLIDKEAFAAERIAALNQPICSRGRQTNEPSDEAEIDVFPTAENPEKVEELKIEHEKINRLKTLFKGLKVFLNREVPREPLVFTLRCLGAEVSWDRTLFVGATFDETDETITHQIVDRPSMEKQYISRYYVQPQWVFDSVNARELLPVEKYLIGCILPPHLSPFIDYTKTEAYNPVDEETLLEATELLAAREKENEDQSDEENQVVETTIEEDTEMSDASEKSEDRETEDAKDKMRKKKWAEMNVSAGKILKEDPVEKKKEEYQEYKLREKMVSKRHRNLYRSMMKGRADRLRDKKLLIRKRVQLEKEKNKFNKATA